MPGVGFENGCAYGCKVKFGGRVRRMASWFWVGLTLFSAACSGQKAEPAADPIAQLRAVPAADPARLAGREGSEHWSNPYLVIRPDRVGLLTGVAANEEQLLKPEEVVMALGHLPGSAWPYGRAVAILVDEKSAGSEEQKVALRRNRGIVVGELANAHVAIHWIPSS